MITVTSLFVLPDTRERYCINLPRLMDAPEPTTMFALPVKEHVPTTRELLAMPPVTEDEDDQSTAEFPVDIEIAAFEKILAKERAKNPPIPLGARPPDWNMR